MILGAPVLEQKVQFKLRIDSGEILCNSNQFYKLPMHNHEAEIVGYKARKAYTTFPPLTIF